MYTLSTMLLLEAPTRISLFLQACERHPLLDKKSLARQTHGHIVRRSVMGGYKQANKRLFTGHAGSAEWCAATIRNGAPQGQDGARCQICNIAGALTTGAFADGFAGLPWRPRPGRPGRWAEERSGVRAPR